MNKQRHAFLKQTAKDYDLSYDIVEEVYNKYGIENLYQELEKILEVF